MDKHGAQQTTDKARHFAIELARLTADTRCTNVVVLDVSSFSPITDFVILATGTSPRQMRTVADDCIELAQTRGFRTMSAGGYGGNSWICVDLIDVVVHVFSDDARSFYDLDNLWGDAVRVAWDRPK